MTSTSLQYQSLQENIGKQISKNPTASLNVSLRKTISQLRAPTWPWHCGAEVPDTLCCDSIWFSNFFPSANIACVWFMWHAQPMCFCQCGNMRKKQLRELGTGSLKMPKKRPKHSTSVLWFFSIRWQKRQNLPTRDGDATRIVVGNVPTNLLVPLIHKLHYTHTCIASKPKGLCLYLRKKHLPTCS